MKKNKKYQLINHVTKVIVYYDKIDLLIYVDFIGFVDFQIRSQDIKRPFFPEPKDYEILIL